MQTNKISALKKENKEKSNLNIGLFIPSDAKID